MDLSKESHYRVVKAKVASCMKNVSNTEWATDGLSKTKLCLGHAIGWTDFELSLKGELEIARLAEKNPPVRKPKDRRHFVSTLLAQNTHSLRREEWSLLSSLRPCHRSAMPRNAFPLPYMLALFLEKTQEILPGNHGSSKPCYWLTM